MKTHYDVLSLEKNCSEKEIRDSFLKLSKKYHPDKNKNSDAHKKFVEVNEAYSILGKPCSRLKYDQSVLHSYRHQREEYKSTGTTVRNSNIFHGYSRNFKYNYNFEKRGNWNSRPQYSILLYCCLLMAFGTGIHLIAFWRYINKKDKQSQKIAVYLNEVRNRAHKLGNDQNLIELYKLAQKQVESKNHRDQITKNWILLNH